MTWSDWLRTRFRDPLYRQSSLVLVATGLSAGTGLLFWIIAARIAPPRQVGLGVGYFAATSFLSYVTSFALPYGLLRFGASVQVGPAANAAFWFSAVTSVIAAVVFVGGASIWSPELAPLLHTPLHIVVFCIFNGGVAVGLLFDSLFIARRRAELAVARAAVAGIGKLILLPLIGRSGLGIAVAVLAPVVCATLLAWLFLPALLPGHRNYPIGWDNRSRLLFSFSVRTFPATLLAGAPPFLLPLLVLGTLGPRVTAYFYVAWNIAFVLQLVPNVISQPTLSEGSAGGTRVVERALRFSLAITVVAVVVVVAGASIIMRLYGPVYVAHGTSALRLFALAAIPACFVSVAGAMLRVENRHLWVTALNGAFCIVALGLAGLGGYALGLIGVAAGWTAGSALAGVFGSALLVGHVKPATN
jgi:O-antigen/teichoic acid export membrane protein